MKFLAELMNQPDDDGDEGGGDFDPKRKQFEAKVLEYLHHLIRNNESLQIYDAVGKPDALKYDASSNQWENWVGDTFSTEELPELMTRNDSGDLQYNY